MLGSMQLDAWKYAIRCVNGFKEMFLKANTFEHRSGDYLYFIFKCCLFKLFSVFGRICCKIYAFISFL